MKIKSFNMVLAVASCLGAAQTGLSYANTQQGQLADAASASDTYTVTCGDAGTAYLETQVRDEPPIAEPTVSAQIQKSTKAKNTSDRIDGNADYSPAVQTQGGSGAYDVVVDKSQQGVESYTLQYQCKDANGSPTATTISAPISNP